MDPPKNDKPSLADHISQYGSMAFDPELPLETREVNLPKFIALLQSTRTLALIPVLNHLIQPGRVQPWLRPPLISALATLPLREWGVQNTIEFILSVHPSNSSYSQSANGGRGSGISHEALNAASRLLSSPPGGMSPETWFSGIAPQLFFLLQGEGEPEMDKAAAFIIGFGILGRKQYGAPGMPGWKVFVEPILRCIDPSIVSMGSHVAKTVATSNETIVTLGVGKVLASAMEVSSSLEKLTTLLTSHPHPSLTRRLLGPILLPLWSISCWFHENEYTKNYYCTPASKLLKTLLQLSSSSSNSDKSFQVTAPINLSMIIRDLTFKGRLEAGKVRWIYAMTHDGGIQIQEPQHSNNPEVPDLTEIDRASDSFIDLVKSIPDLDLEISNLFMDLCIRWLADGERRENPTIITRIESRELDYDVKSRVIEAKIMQKLMTSFPEKLVNDSRQVLDLVSKVLSQYNAEDGSDEDTATIALSLLNIVLTSPSFRETPEIKIILENIKSSLLGLINKNTHSDLSSTARNLLMLIKFRHTIEEHDTSTSQVMSDRQMEDRKTYNLAFSYLTATDSPPPVRVQGLELISILVRANSSILDIPALLVIFSTLLQDNEEYIYLRAIQSFLQLSQTHPKAVMKDLIDRYTDLGEDYELDQRLRLGEALVQVIQTCSSVFKGESAASICHGLLSIAGRRAVRPKTQQTQEKRNRLKRETDREAEDAWDGPVPQLDEILDDEFQEDNEILSQIISGWEGKRGTEDVRIRASAVSILGSSIEANAVGIGSTLISAMVDLSIHILTLEPEPEKGILRRSAILLVMSFVRVLDLARAEGRKLGFGFVGQSLDEVQRILKYLGGTDNDGLVRQHAKDVVESLHAWQIYALLPSQNSQMEVQELAGLSINLGRADATTVRMRPRIEEVD